MVDAIHGARPYLTLLSVDREPHPSCCSTAPACGSAPSSGCRRRSPRPTAGPVNALRGFLDAVATLITRERPSRLVVCLDEDWRPQWRVDLIPSYKAHRVEEERAGGRTRRRRGARRSDPAGRHDHGDPRRVRHRRPRARPAARPTTCSARWPPASARDPVVVVSGDRDLLQLVARRARAGPGALHRPRPGEGDHFGPAGGRRHLRRAARPRRARLRRVGAAARRSVRRPARRAGRRREDGGHPAGTARLARGDPRRRRTTRRRRCRRPTRRSCWRPPTTSRRPSRWSGWRPTPPVNLSDDVRRAAAGRASIHARSPSSPTNTASRRRSAGCRRRSTRCPEASTTWVDRPRRCRCRPGRSPSPDAWCRRC